MRAAPALVLAALLLSGCAAGSSQPENLPVSPEPSLSFSAEKVVLDADGRKMPWPKYAWQIGDSPDRLTVEKSAARPNGVVDPPAGQGYERYYSQQLDWQPCGDYVCTKFLAPLDWENPDGLAVTIAMRKSSAEDAKGVLFVNPGGPGGSAQAYVEKFDDLDYDVIGIDPRGSGESTPVDCGSTEALDSYFSVDVSPDDQAEIDQLVEAEKRFARDCRQNTGELLDHISTIDTAYDYDLARRLLGVEKINFFGVSYGTLLGATYAELFPEHLGRMVLDSAVNFGPEEHIPQAQGFERNLREFAKWCAKRGSCSLGDDESTVTAKIIDFVESLDASPLTSASGRVLSQTQAVSGLLLFFYGEDDFYKPAAKAFEAALDGNPDLLLAASDAMIGRKDGRYSSLIAAATSIGCIDTPDEGLEAAMASWRAQTEQAPLLGHLLGPETVCPLWGSEPRPKIAFEGETSEPILILGNTNDSATPYEQSVLASQVFSKSRLVTRQAAGHGVYGKGSCADEIVRQYFADGQVPEANLTCSVK